MSIDETIDDWKAHIGEIKTSERGTTYLVVPLSNLRGHLLSLIQTMTDRGFSEEEIKAVAVNTKIAKACWSDLIVRLSTKEIKRNRDISTSIWREALKEYFAKPISEYVETKKAVAEVEIKPLRSEPTKEELLKEILNPKDRLVSTKKIEYTDDAELMAELGLEIDDE